MRFSWKVFFMTIVIIMLSFAACGYALISSLFRASLNREIALAREENKLLRFSLETASSTYSSGSFSAEDIAKTAELIQGGPRKGTLRFRISDEDGSPIFQTGLFEEASRCNER
jgi:hypothetical protein